MKRRGIKLLAVRSTYETPGSRGTGGTNSIFSPSSAPVPHVREPSRLIEFFFHHGSCKTAPDTAPVARAVVSRHRHCRRIRVTIGGVGCGRSRMPRRRYERRRATGEDHPSAARVEKGCCWTPSWKTDDDVDTDSTEAQDRAGTRGTLRRSAPATKVEVRRTVCLSGRVVRGAGTVGTLAPTTTARGVCPVKEKDRTMVNCS